MKKFKIGTKFVSKDGNNITIDKCGKDDDYVLSSTFINGKGDQIEGEELDGLNYITVNMFTKTYDEIEKCIESGEYVI